MYTAMLTVENIVQGAGHDIWSVNVEEEYHEEKDSPDGSSEAATASDSADSASASRPSVRNTGRDAPILPKGSR